MTGASDYGIWYSGIPASAAQGLWQPLAPVPVTYSVQPAPVTVTYSSSVTTTATAQSSWAIQYISAAYGQDWAVSREGIKWRTRALTMEELTGEVA